MPCHSILLVQGHDDYRDLFLKYAVKQLALNYTNQTFGWPRRHKMRRQEGVDRGMAVGYTRSALAELQARGGGRSRLRGNAASGVDDDGSDKDEDDDEDATGGADGDDTARQRKKQQRRRARQGLRRRRARGGDKSVVELVTQDLVQLIKEADYEVEKE
jgi:hypothetical protein